MIIDRSGRRRLAATLTASVFLTFTVLSPAAAKPTPDEIKKLPDISNLKSMRAHTKGFTGKWFVQLSEKPTLKGGSVLKVASQQASFRKAVADKSVSVDSSYSRIWNGLTVSAKDDQALAKVSSAPNVVAMFPVVEVKRPETQRAPQNKPDMTSAVAMTGANFARTELGLTGKGIKIGIIDSGIDIDHKAFGGNGVSEASHAFPTKKVVAGWDFVGDAYSPNPGADNYSPTPKPDAIPDDCDGHGTHVAGIAAGNDPSTGFRGVAPDALLGAYRVFGCDGSSDSEIIMAAMERAAKDGMDVVNISIGAPYTTWPNYPTAVAANALTESGVSVFISQGNSGDRGMFSSGSPSVAEKVVSVGSVNNSGVSLSTFRLDNGTLVGYLPVNGAAAPPTSGTLELASYPEGKKTGAVDLPGTPFEGKAALVSRGETTFYEKAVAAQADGAKAVIIYNNEPGLLNASASPDLTLPAVTITQDEGKKLEDLVAKGKTTITWTEEKVASHNHDDGVVSNFSSYGPSATLELKPDVVAPGGRIYSAFPLDSDAVAGGYATLSGTSMASPHAAGAAALLLQSNPALLPENVHTVLQNTSVPVLLSNPIQRGFPSQARITEAVHKQGGGLINIPNAVAQANSYAKVGSGELPSLVTPSKISLRDTDTTEVTTLTLTNRSDQEITYNLSSDLSAAATWGPGTFPQVIAGLNPGVRFSAKNVTVPANSTRTVDVTVTAPNQHTSYTNGTGTPAELKGPAMYGGWVVLSTSDGRTMRVPFQGLSGDYEQLSAIYPKLTYGDVFDADVLNILGIDPKRKFAIEPSLGIVSKCPNGRLEGVDCADDDGEYDFVEGADHVYSMRGYDFPRILLHIDTPVSKFDMRVYKANEDGSKGEAVGPYNYVYRSDGQGADSGFQQFSWDGTVKASETAKESTPVPDGRYILEVTVTKGLGKAQNGENTEVFATKPFIVREVPKAQKPNDPGNAVDPLHKVYTTEGTHAEQGRSWRTTCTQQPEAKRCMTEVLGAQITTTPRRLASKQQWLFHTYTYLPSARSAWKNNPLGGNGEVGYNQKWTKDGQQFRTECDTAASGKGACRTYVLTSPLKPVSDTRRDIVKQVKSDWALYSIVLFN